MFDKTQLEKLLELSDSQLRKKLSDAAISMGADKFKTAKALADMSKLREMMVALTPSQINAILEKLGPEAAEKLASKLNNEDKE